MILALLRISFPCHRIDSWRRSSLKCEEGCPEDIYIDMMQQRRQLFLPVSVYCFSYAGLRL
jgi:hypothetical protein